MLCVGFPHYNGGYPMSGIIWDDEIESYRCLQGGGISNSSYCHKWETLENSADEYELGVCTCTSTGTEASSGRSNTSVFRRFRFQSLPFYATGFTVPPGTASSVRRRNARMASTAPILFNTQHAAVTRARTMMKIMMPLTANVGTLLRWSMSTPTENATH